MADAATGNIGVSGRAALVPLPGEPEVQARAAGENFSVASLLLPREPRTHLRAIYGYARLVDELGDAQAGDRLATLARFEQDLARVFAPDGEPEHPVLRRLRPSVQALELPPEPFADLLEANRQDQLVHRYETYEQLLDYCRLSANPVGVLVLHVFGAATPERLVLSDAVCSALQLLEHWQDVAEDARAGRVYVPAEDLERYGVEPAELLGAASGPRLRALVAFEVERARALLDRGAPLVGTLRRSARLAVAGYVGGGRAGLDAIEAAGCEVLAGPPSASASARLRASLRTYRRGA